MENAKTLYAECKDTLKAVRRLPEEEQRSLLNMLRGAVVISDLYAAQGKAERPGA